MDANSRGSAVSGLTLEAYAELHDALTRHASSSNTVGPINQQEAAWFKTKDLQQLLLIHGLADSYRKKKELLDSMQGMQLFPPLPDFSVCHTTPALTPTLAEAPSNSGAAQGPSQQPPPAALDSGAGKSAPQAFAANPTKKQPRITAFFPPPASKPGAANAPKRPQGLAGITLQDLMPLGWFHAGDTHMSTALQQPPIIFKRTNVAATGPYPLTTVHTVSNVPLDLAPACPAVQSAMLQTTIRQSTSTAAPIPQHSALKQRATQQQATQQEPVPNITQPLISTQPLPKTVHNTSSTQQPTLTPQAAHPQPNNLQSHGTSDPALPAATTLLNTALQQALQQVVLNWQQTHAGTGMGDVGMLPAASAVPQASPTWLTVPSGCAHTINLSQKQATAGMPRAWSDPQQLPQHMATAADLGPAFEPWTSSGPVQVNMAQVLTLDNDDNANHGVSGSSRMSWLAAELLRFSQASGVVACQDVVTSTQMANRRVGFLLLNPLEQRDGSGRVAGHVPAGIHQAAVLRYVGSGCRYELCDEGCPGGHEWCTVRLLGDTVVPYTTAEHGRPLDRVELTLDLHNRHRLGTLDELLPLADQDQKLQDAWLLLKVHMAWDDDNDGDGDGDEDRWRVKGGGRGQGGRRGGGARAGATAGIDRGGAGRGRGAKRPLGGD